MAEATSCKLGMQQDQLMICSRRDLGSVLPTSEGFFSLSDEGNVDGL